MADKINLDLVRMGGGTQSRFMIDPPTIGDYKEAMEGGAKFPPVTLFYDGESYWLADGYHRVYAARELGHAHILADVKQGTQRDAQLFSVGANATHGLRRTSHDKRRAVEMLLMDDEWRQWSDREIARRAAVSHVLVGNIRKNMESTGKITSGDGQRKTADGRVMNTTNIGKTDPPKPEKTPEEKYGFAAGDAVIVEARDLPATVHMVYQHGIVRIVVDKTQQILDVRCDELKKAIPRVAEPLCVGDQVKTRTGRIGIVTDVNARKIMVQDVNGARLHNLETLEKVDAEQPSAPAFQVGDKVIVNGSDVVGEVTGVKDGRVRVTRPETGNEETTNMTHWVSADKVSAAPDLDDDLPVIGTPEFEVYNALQSLWSYSNGESELYPAVLHDIDRLQDWLDGLRADIHSEIEQIESEEG